MGGIIIILATVFPTILWMRPDNPYFLPILFVVLALGGVGFMDDYIKIIKKDKAGLMGRFKIAGQVAVGLVVASFLYFHPDFESYNTISTVPFLEKCERRLCISGRVTGMGCVLPPGHIRHNRCE